MIQRFVNEFKLYSAINKDLHSETYPELHESFKASLDLPLSGLLHSTTTNDEFLIHRDLRSIND